MGTSFVPPDPWKTWRGWGAPGMSKKVITQALKNEKGLSANSLKTLLDLADTLDTYSETDLNPEVQRIKAGLEAARYFANPELLRRATAAQEAQTEASRKAIETSGQEARERIVQELSARGLLGGSGEQQQKGKAQAVESQALLNLAMEAAKERDTPQRELATAESQALADIIAAENDKAAAVRAGEATGQIGGLLGALQSRWQDTSNAIRSQTEGSLGELLGNVANTGAGFYDAGERLRQRKYEDAFDDWFTNPGRKNENKPKKSSFSMWS